MFITESRHNARVSVLQTEISELRRQLRRMERDKSDISKVIDSLRIELKLTNDEKSKLAHVFRLYKRGVEQTVRQFRQLPSQSVAKAQACGSVSGCKCRAFPTT